MYIPEFWCGVLAVIGIEVIAIFIWVIYYNIRKGKNNEKERV